MDAFGWKILLLVAGFFGLIALLAFSGSISQWFFRRFQLRGLLRRRGWQDRTEPPQWTRRELFVLRQREGEPTWQEGLHIAGSHRGYEFSAKQRYGYGRVNQKGEPQLVNDSFVEVYATGIPAMRDVWVSPLTGKVTINQRTKLPPELAHWLRRNRFRGHQFSTRQGLLKARIGSRIFRRRLLRKLNYLIGVAENWPGAAPHKPKRRTRSQ